MKKIIIRSAAVLLIVSALINHTIKDASAQILAPSFSSNVVFIPGIEASRLYSHNLLHEDQLWEPNTNSDVTDLYLDSSGNSKKDVYTKDIIGKTNVCFGCALDQDIYKDFETFLDGLKSSNKIADWKAFPYDWRLALATTLESGAKLPDGTFQKITDLLEAEANTSRTGKVSVVTHSNGGLLLKLLLNKLQSEKDAGENNLIDKIDKAIMVAPPQYGTPVAIAGLLHGDEQELGRGILLNNAVARGLGENMPGAYGLLPSPAYFQASAAPVITFDKSVLDLKNKFDLYGQSITTRADLDAFLLASKDGRLKPNDSDVHNPNILNPALISQSEAVHSIIDNYTFPSTIKTYAIAGIGLPTVTGINYFAKKECLFASLGCSYAVDRNLVQSPDGDGTVIAESAIGTIANHYYLDLAALSSASGVQYEHKNIMEAISVESFISNALSNRDSLLPAYMSTEKPDVSQTATFEISSHSPVSLDAYDLSGNHTGVSQLNSSTSPFTLIDEGILNGSYYQIGDEKYISVPANGDYTIKLKGLDAGTFTLNINKVVGGQVVASSSFDNIPVSLGEQASLPVSTTATSSDLAIDTDGDGRTDLVIKPGDSLDPASYLQLLRDTILNLKLKTSLQNELFMKIERLMILIKQSKIKQVKNSIKQFADHLGLTRKWYKNLTGDNRALIVASIGSFIDQYFSQ